MVSLKAELSHPVPITLLVVMHPRYRPTARLPRLYGVFQIDDLQELIDKFIVPGRQEGVAAVAEP